MLEKNLSFEEWRNLLVEKMRKYQIGPDLIIKPGKIPNNDVPDFLEELEKFIEDSRKQKLMIGKIEKMVENFKELKEMATIDYYLKNKKQPYIPAKSKPYITNYAA